MKKKYFIIAFIFLLVIFTSFIINKRSKDKLSPEEEYEKHFQTLYSPMCNIDNCTGEAGIVKGVIGNGFKFNNSVFIEIDSKDLNSIGSNNFTINFRFKKDKDTIGDMFSKGNSNDTWFAFTQRNSKWFNQVWFQFDDGVIPKEVKHYESVDYNWHRAIIDGIRRENDWIIGVYIDGKLFDNSRVLFENYGLINNTAPLFLGTACGADFSLANSEGCFEYWGSIDEFRIFDENREAVVDLTFDNIEGDQIIDSSGNGNNATIHWISPFHN